MIEQSEITHHIQKYILEVLYHRKSARFRDLRPPKVDTNLYSYHLKLLQKNGFVEKVDEGYSLAQKGLAYVDRVSEKSMNLRMQPKIVTMIVIQNSNGDVLLWKRAKQPYIETWTLPYGKLHIDDETIKHAATRELQEKLQFTGVPEHAGDCYIRVKSGNVTLSSTLAHVFRLKTDAITESERVRWARPHKLSRYDLAPAVEQIIARTFFRDAYFFEEFTVNW